MHHRNPDAVLQAFQGADDEGAMGPGAGVGHIEMVAPGGSWETALTAGSRGSVGRDPVAESGTGSQLFAFQDGLHQSFIRMQGTQESILRPGEGLIAVREAQRLG